MRVLILFTSLMAAWTIQGQTNNAGPVQSFGAQIPGPQRTAPAPRPTKPNEIPLGNVTLGGIVVQALKSKNPLQLINPAAPPAYGSGEDNVVRDPTTGRATGLKVFAIQF